MKAPSTLLLRALLRPQPPVCQLRWKSDWMPREKYAKITSLDKLHRKQKVAVRKERQDSEDRANNMYPKSLAPPPSPLLNPATGGTILSPTICSLPYYIVRTPSLNLPIYESTKSGGSKHITTIRKIKGDLHELASAVRGALQLDEHLVDVRGRKKKNIVINHITRQVIVRGWRGPEIKKWAEMNGF